MSTQISPPDHRNGIISAVSAYLLWGLAPIYFKLISEVTADEIMVHRVLWSCVLLFFIVIAIGKGRVIVNLLTEAKHVLIRLTITASFLGVNWFLFIWAVNNDHLLDASLGYFINPLFSVALGMLFLSERLSRWQLFAVFLAIVGVLIQLVTLGSVPVISLALAGTFGIYGLLRKKIAVDTFVGLLVESLLMLPIALIYWFFFVESSTSNLLTNTWTLNISLAFAGVVTTAPLLCFTAAAKRLSLSTLGFFQYIGPSIMFVLATFYYQEPLETAKLVTFVFIWFALLIYSTDSLNRRKKRLRGAAA
ncbi:EamA family transporter RarD [Thalassotalea ganghwensis]